MSAPRQDAPSGAVGPGMQASTEQLYITSDRQGHGARWTDELRTLVRLSVPIAVAQVGLMAMGLVDTAILGRTGKDALAGAGIGRNLGFFAQTLMMGVAIGLEPLASQALGAGQPGEARAALRGTLKALLVLWPFAVGFALLLTLLLGPLGVEAATIPVARTFLFAQAPALLFFTMFLAGKTYLQAHGKTRPALIAAGVANVVNYFACQLLVRGSRPLGVPALGALGSGIAMSIGSAVLAGIVLWSAWQLDRDVAEAPAPGFARLARTGMPIALTLAAEIGVFVLAAMLAGRLGNAVTSAHQIAISLASFTFMGALGVSGATAVRVGRAVGEGVPPRRRGMLGIALGAAVMTSGVVLFATAPRALVSLFSKEPEVVELGAALVRIAAVFQLFDGVQCVAGGALRGAGDLRFAFAGSALGYWLVGLPIALALGFGLGWGATGIWWGLTAGLVAVSVALTLRFWFTSGRVLRRVG